MLVDCLSASRSRHWQQEICISETTCTNMLPVCYTFMPLRASLSKLEEHMPLSGILLRHLSEKGFFKELVNISSRLTDYSSLFSSLSSSFPVWKNPRWRPPPSWKNFKWPYLHNWSSDPLHVLFYGGFFGDGVISANHMYGQFTCLQRQHHITSLLMRKTLELDFVQEDN